jgi:hypothetical protein
MSKPGALAVQTHFDGKDAIVEQIYSDHDHQLILVVDDHANGLAVSEAWSRGQ